MNELLDIELDDLEEEETGGVNPPCQSGQGVRPDSTDGESGEQTPGPSTADDEAAGAVVAHPIESDEEEDEEEDEFEQPAEGSARTHGNLKYVKIISECGKTNTAFRSNVREVAFRLKKRFSNPDCPPRIIKKAIHEMAEYITDGCSPYDAIGVIVNSADFSKGRAWLSYRAVAEFKAEDLVNLFESVAQSQRSFVADETFIITATVFKPAVGKGKMSANTLKEVNQKSVLIIKNDDALCLPRALICGEVYLRKTTSPEWLREWKSVRGTTTQGIRARALVDAAGVTIDQDSGCGPAELLQFQRYFADRGICIRVFDYDTFGEGKRLEFDGERDLPGEYKSYINIAYHSENEGHFNLILSLLGVKPGRYFCAKCNKSYKRVNDHRCNNICRCCYNVKACCETGASKRCEDCMRIFVSEECYARHKVVGSASRGFNLNSNRKASKSICDYVKFCEGCNKVYSVEKSKNHECGKSHCRLCKNTHNSNELCCMQPVKSSARKKK